MSETSPAPTSILYIILPFLGIILGWILGLLSPFITRQFKRKQEIGDFKKGIYIELIEIKIYLVLLRHMFLNKVTELNREVMSWCYDNLREHEEFLPDETAQRLLGRFRLMSECSDNEFTEHLRAAEYLTLLSSNTSLVPKKIHMPFYKNGLNNLPMMEHN